MSLKLIRIIKRSTFSSAVPVEALQNGTWEQTDAKPYTEIPGPRKLPIVGNSWRFAPFIGEYGYKRTINSICSVCNAISESGHYKIGELDKVMLSLREEYGKVVRVSGLFGHPDLVFAFTPQSIESVFRQEEVLPHRPSMPSLSHYKKTLRRDFFGDSAGVIGV